VRADLDPVVAAAGVLGALELSVSGMVVGLVPAGDERQIDVAKRVAADLILRGLRAGA
jgi:TetR/AcrR family fatty acid metabolism transcriptional regulator